MSSLLRGGVLLGFWFLVAALITGCMDGDEGRSQEGLIEMARTPSSAVLSPSPVLHSAATATFTAMPTATATSTAMPTATATSTSTAVPSATATAMSTAMPTSTVTPTGTATASALLGGIDQIKFVENDDCVDGISRELLATRELSLKYGDVEHVVVVELADEPGERVQGLMCREVVPEGTGMLFVFEESYPLNFWMFNTYVSLDILYFDDSLIPLIALRMEPCPRPDGYDDDSWRSHCSTFSSAYGSVVPARYALELPAGWLERIGVKSDRLEGLELSW